MSNYSTSSRMGRQLARQPYPGREARDNSPEPPIALLKPSEVVPSSTYIERGQRWMEKEEAVSLRDALEDMDLKEQEEEEARLHAAAQEEASELVWQHQNPGAIKPDGPYYYKEHLRKNSYAHARTQSVGRYSGVGLVTGLARDIPRSVSGGSSNSGGMPSQSRSSSGSSGTSPQLPTHPTSASDANAPLQSTVISKVQKPYHGLSNTTGSSSRRRSSGRRNISNELAESFSPDQIWEEPAGPNAIQDQPQKISDTPMPLRIKPRNPLNRVQFAQDLSHQSKNAVPEPAKKLSKSEIHQNPPSQSRNPAYTSNLLATTSTVRDRPEVPSKDGIEIRSDDIRQATSKSLRDRSPRLPTPAVVSDKPGRPIVSFDANWKPREADLKPVEEPQNSRHHRRFVACSESKSLPNIPPTKNPSPASIPTIQLPEPPSIQINGTDLPPVPSINFPSTVPTINFPDIPVISVTEHTSTPKTTGTNTSDIKHGSSRPLPDPKTSSSRPLPRHQSAPATAMSRSHWSPAIGNRATAKCHQCDLPIEGRVVALRGIAERFHPHCFICYSCGTGLEALEISPEPDEKRAERLDRIRRRARGEQLDEIDGQTMQDDGDERLRFFCHLDWHELYAPRCKHCKTPIIGEHAVALGEHWHYGHFFCAECGDPFEQGMTHIEKDGYAWCLNCQTKRTERRAPKCKKCRGPVIGQYVQALGGEYHDECFRCATCNGGFDDGQIFPRESGNETVAICVKCIQRELKA